MLARLVHQWKSSRLRFSLAGVGASTPSPAIDVQAGLTRIREHCKREGCFSWTSDQYQHDLQEFILNHRTHGCGIIEVGCFRGGLSAQLAFVAQQFNWPFYAMDVDGAATKATTRLLNTLGVGANSVVFHGSLDQFARVTKLHYRPALIVIDGDHLFDAVQKDIDYVYQLNLLPYAAAFHDFSLRHPVIDERVDEAIYSKFGASAAVKRIGQNTAASAAYPTREAPAADGHYWNANGSEGALLVLPPTLPRERSVAA